MRIDIMTDNGFEEIELVRSLRAFYPRGATSKHMDISRGRIKGIGDWFFKTLEFIEWLNNRNEPFLWGYGISGAGKTCLSSSIIDFLMAREATVVAHHYFRCWGENLQRPENILGNLLEQMSTQIPNEISTLFEELLAKKTEHTPEEFYAAILTISKKLSNVFIIFDALDDCDPKYQRAEILPLIERMGSDGMKVLFTSRPHQKDIQSRFYNAVKIELAAKPEDIETYVRTMINKHPRMSDLIRQAKCEDRVISELIDSAHGMFRFVVLQFEHISKQTTAEKILDVLDRLKLETSINKPLDTIYDKILAHMQSDLAFLTLTWIVLAERKLVIDEIRAAVSINSDPYRPGVHLPDTAELLDMCCGLVIMGKDHSVQLAHPSIREYLLRKRKIPNDHITIATACGSLLSSDIFSQGICTSRASLTTRLQENPLLDYAAKYWAAHLQHCDERSTTNIVLKFLTLQGNVFSYLQAKNSSTHDQGEPVGGGQTLLHVASDIGHLVAVRTLLKGHDTSSIQDENGLTPLHLAASRGHEGVVRVLLKRMNGPLTTAKDGKTALNYAATHGHEGVVQLLLEKEANLPISKHNKSTLLSMAASTGDETVFQFVLEKSPDPMTPDESGLTALHFAASQGFGTTMKSLLHMGVDLNVVDKDSKTAFYYAASEGHLAAVDLLLENNADPSIPDRSGQIPLIQAMNRGNGPVVDLLLQKGVHMIAANDGRTALHLAALQGSKAVVQKILENSADPSIQDMHGWTALSLAASEGYEEVVRILLEMGADVSRTTEDGRTALHCAASQGHLTLVMLLLEKGADHSKQTKDGKTALHLSVPPRAKFLKPFSTARHEETLQLFIDKGANISTPDKHGWMALHTAVFQGSLGATMILLEAGADLSARTNEGKTALSLVASEGHEEVVSLLLKKGADPSTIDKHEQTVLGGAVFAGHGAAVRLLLDNGASFLHRSRSGSTLLSIAAYDGQKEMVRMLLQKGASTEDTDIQGRTPLYRAASKGHKEVIQLLLGLKADLSIPDKYGWTPLCRAAFEGHEAVVRLLLKEGADASTRVGRKSAVEMARSNGHTGILRQLERSLQSGERAGLGSMETMSGTSIPR